MKSLRKKAIERSVFQRLKGHEAYMECEWLGVYDNFRERTCSVCGSSVVKTSYHEEYWGEVESEEWCKADCYKYGYSYGPMCFWVGEEQVDEAEFFPLLQIKKLQRKKKVRLFFSKKKSQRRR